MLRSGAVERKLLNQISVALFFINLLYSWVFLIKIRVLRLEKFWGNSSHKIGLLQLGKSKLLIVQLGQWHCEVRQWPAPTTTITTITTIACRWALINRIASIILTEYLSNRSLLPQFYWSCCQRETPASATSNYHPFEGSSSDFEVILQNFC